MKKLLTKILCIMLCTTLFLSCMEKKALGEYNQAEAEKGSVIEGTATEQITIEEFFSHLREYYNHVRRLSLFKDCVCEFLSLNYSNCSAELIAELIEKKYIENVYINSTSILRDIWSRRQLNMITAKSYDEIDAIGFNSFFLNPDDQAFFSYISEDIITFDNGISNCTMDKKALKRFIEKYEKAYQEITVEDINKWFILSYIGTYAQFSLWFFFDEGIIASNGSKKIEGYKMEKLDEYIDYNASSFDHLVLREGVVLDYNSNNEYIAYLGAMDIINHVVDEFNTNIIISYENKLKDRLQYITTNKDNLSADEVLSTSRVFYGASFEQISADGFLVPVPKSFFWDVDISNYHGGYIYQASGESKFTDINPVFIRAFCSESIFAEDPDVARTEIEKEFNQITNSYENVEKKIIILDGHPVGLIKYTLATEEDVGYIIYIRNNRRLTITVGTDVYWISSNSYTNPIDISDLEELAGKLSYDENLAPFTAAKATFTINTKNGENTVSAGKNLQMTTVFDYPEIINKEAKNDIVTWSVLNAQTNKIMPGVTINTKGQLSISKDLDMPVQLQVKATSIFGTEASSVITALPVVSKVVLDPAQLFFYVGTENPQTARASLEPASVPPVGLTWTPAKKDIVEITPVEDGVVSIKPLKAGKTDIAVKEPGGKNAKLTVNVVAPVESVELKVNGKPKAGGKVTVAAALAPKNVGNKAVQWSLDVGEEIATINEKGQLTIGKEVASGTKITVTCTALGAPAPITSTIVIEVP